MKIRIVAVCGFMLLTLMSALSTFAQVVQDRISETSVIPQPCDQPSDNSCLLQSDELKNLEPSVTERLLRSWQYQFQLLEQPAVLVATSDGTTATIPNPNKWLQQHSITLTLAEWFPRSTNLPFLVQTVYDYHDPDHKGLAPVFLDKNLCGNHATTLSCLASGGSWWGRLFSGATLTFSVSQRDEVEQGVVIPTLSASEGWAWNGELDFNPASLFITSANWKNAVSVLAEGQDKSRNIKLLKNEQADTSCIYTKESKESKLGLAGCVTKFTKPSLTSSLGNTGWADFAAVAIPTFQLKALSQFDFLKQGGILTESPLLQRSLKSMTFTWDLRRLIAATTDRVAIGALYDQAQKTPKLPDNTKVTKLCVLKSKSAMSYINVAEDSTMNACRGLAVALGGVDQYAVACAADRIVYIGVSAGINQRPAELNKPATNCGWIGGDEINEATTPTSLGVQEAFVRPH
jgi:hypothetical protein